MTDLKLREQRNAKVLIAYHAYCMDGFTAAWACHKGLAEKRGVEASNITLLPVEYGKLADTLDKAWLYDAIYFVDFSVSLDHLAKLVAVARITIIDHHKTAIDMYANCDLSNFDAEIVLDLKECGASLVWKYFFPDTPIPTLIQYVKDRDLWQHKLPGTKPLNMYIKMQQQTLSNWDRLCETFATSYKLDVAANLGDAMLAYHDLLVDQFVSLAEPCSINGFEGLVVNAPGQFASDAGNKLQQISNTYGATWFQAPGGEVKWSLRSSGEYDVAEIAAKFGGGGHKNAAGFVLKAPKESAKQLGVTLWAK